MDSTCKQILQTCNIEFQEMHELEGQLIPRETLLDLDKYHLVKIHIAEMKKTFSSSLMTCLQKNAKDQQKWPLLNMIRQILHLYRFKMTPVRKSDGYTLDGIKKFKRFFCIQKVTNDETL